MKKESKLVMGTAIGVGTDNLGLWIGVGIGIGTAIGFVLMKRGGNKDGDASA